LSHSLVDRPWPPARLLTVVCPNQASGLRVLPIAPHKGNWLWLSGHLLLLVLPRARPIEERVRKDGHVNVVVHKPKCPVGNAVHCRGHERHVGELTSNISSPATLIPAAHDISDHKELQTAEIPKGLKRVRHTSRSHADRGNVPEFFFQQIARREH